MLLRGDRGADIHRALLDVEKIIRSHRSRVEISEVEVLTDGESSEDERKKKVLKGTERETNKRQLETAAPSEADREDEKPTGGDEGRSGSSRLLCSTKAEENDADNRGGQSSGEEWILICDDSLRASLAGESLCAAASVVVEEADLADQRREDFESIDDTTQLSAAAAATTSSLSDWRPDGRQRSSHLSASWPSASGGAFESSHASTPTRKEIINGETNSDFDLSDIHREIHHNSSAGGKSYAVMREDAPSCTVEGRSSLWSASAECSSSSGVVSSLREKSFGVTVDGEDAQSS